MNYRHAYHAGNFADLLKHAVLTTLLRQATKTAEALTVIDTHAGAGLYDLSGDAARQTGEGIAGIGRLMADHNSPDVFADLKAAVGQVNRGGGLRYYPGSPVLIEAAMRCQDRLYACEVRADDHAALVGWQTHHPGVEKLKADGWVVAADRTPRAPAPALLLIDPPFERSDDAEQAIKLTAQVLRRNRASVVAIWTPIKDLTTFDAFLVELTDETMGAVCMSAEVRLRPLTNPMRMNGCAMVVLNAPLHISQHILAAADWIASNLGEPGGSARVEWLNLPP